MALTTRLPWTLDVRDLRTAGGRRAAALAQYEICCRQLADELGLEPMPETTALYRQIQAGSYRPPVAVPDTAPGSAPEPERDPSPVDPAPVTLPGAAPAAVLGRRLTLLQIYGSLFFAAAKNLEQMLPTVDEADRAVVALALRGNSEIGSTFVGVLRRYAEALHARDSKLMLVGVDAGVFDLFARTGLLQLIGEDNIFRATPQLGEAMNLAIAAAGTWLDQAPAGAKSENA